MKIAVIGGGVAGAAFVHNLVMNAVGSQQKLCIDLFDQGRALGGRSSHRVVKAEDDKSLEFDHGCQFLRADTPRMQDFLSKFVKSGVLQEWKGDFACGGKEGDGESDFFGMPQKGPFYVGVGGMHKFPLGIVAAAEEAAKSSTCELAIHPTTRVSKLLKGDDDKWKLEGTGGKAALHDTKESEAKQAVHGVLEQGYDLVVLTDVSSTSFDSWHRASAGVPDSFAQAVRARVGARVPLLTAMVAFAQPLPVSCDTLTFPLDAEGRAAADCWFAARTNSKPGFREGLSYECWTVVSTPAYAAREITATPMQTPEGAFVPQEKGYLDTVAEHLVDSFLGAAGVTGAQRAAVSVVYKGAQRWGSAMPAPRHLATNEESPTRRVVCSVPYDTGRGSLAPTMECREGGTFHVDKELGLLQIGDFVGSHTPGMESSVLSACDAADFVASMM